MKTGMFVKVKKGVTAHPSGGPLSEYAGKKGIVARTPPVPGFDVRILIEGKSICFQESELILLGWESNPQD